MPRHCFLQILSAFNTWSILRVACRITGHPLLDEQTRPCQSIRIEGEGWLSA